MPALLQIALINAVLATLLACVVALVARKVRRPALVHALWLVVLFKLVTPPLFEVPIHVPLLARILPRSAANGFRDSEDVAAATAAAQSATSEAVPSAADGDVTMAEGVGSVREAQHSSAIRVAVSSGWVWFAEHWGAVALWVWFGGSAVWFARQGLTTLRFSRRLALATPAPEELQHHADRLARGMGLSYRPPVLIVRDVISPMLWGIGRNARLLFPVELLTRLDAEGRETLIAHELAHFRRGDHWVRTCELIISGIYWWHPVVWWARREIEISEEECCDAWVMEQFPDAPRCYAEALLETIDFLSEESLVLPPAAAGLGHVPLLRRRLTAIMRGAAPKEMSPAQWAAFFAAAMCLPLHPALASSSPPRPLPASLATVDFDPQEVLADSTDLPDAGIDASTEPQAEESPKPRETRPFPLDSINAPWATAVSPDPGRRFSLTRRKDTVVLYDREADKTTDLSAYHILTAVFSKDGKTFVTGDDVGVVRLWASSTGEMLKAFHGGHADRIQGVAFIHDGLDLISASRDGTIRLWNIELGSELSTLASNISPLNCLSVSPDGRWLAVGTGHWKSVGPDGRDPDGRVLIWDLATLKRQAVFPSERPVGALVFKPDCNTLLAGTLWGQVDFWDLRERRQIGTTLGGYKDAVAAAQFSTDTLALAQVGLDQIYRAPPPELPGAFGNVFGPSAIRTAIVPGGTAPTTPRGAGLPSQESPADAGPNGGTPPGYGREMSRPMPNVPVSRFGEFRGPSTGTEFNPADTRLN